MILIEPGRGVYDARRAAALAGIPKSTLHYWAREGIYTPSIARGPRLRLWSWADLLALRAIDWLRRKKGPNEPATTSMRKIRQAIAELSKLGVPHEVFAEAVRVSVAGDLYFPVGGTDMQATPAQQGAWAELLPFIRPYHAAPDLLEPQPLLRIIPGKLHGEPHLLDTRIPSAAIYALHERGYTPQDLLAMYPEASEPAIKSAIDFERSLRQPQTA
jgi:uncharacterized protein (DUF433 family)/DNA-binding transcriptional MerR regulator